MLQVSALVTIFVATIQFSQAQNQSYSIRLDSIVGDVDKSFFKYDAQGNLITFESYLYKEDRLCGEENYIKEFDSQGNLILEEYYEWNRFKSRWSRYPVYRTTYNSRGQTTSFSLASYYDMAGLWFYQTKYEKSYNTNGQLLTYNSYVWDAMDEIWVPEYETQVTYVEGVKKLSQMFRWNEITQNWEKTTKIEYATDDLGNSVGVKYCWDKENSEWVYLPEKKKYEYTYKTLINGDSLVIVEAYENVNDTWQLNRRSEETYDYNGNVIFYYDSIASSYTNDWHINKRKFEYDYDENNNVLFCTSWEWEDENQMFIPTVKALYQYDDEDREILQRKFRWYASLNDWRENQRFENEYDKNGNHTGYAYTLYSNGPVGRKKYKKEFDEDNNILSHIDYKWDYTNKSWVENTKIEYTYAYSYASDEILKPSEFDEMFYHQAIHHNNYKFVDGEWLEIGTAIYYYSDDLISGIPQGKVKESISIYPNPTSGFITIDKKDNDGHIELLNTNGIRVLYQKIPQNNSLYVGSLPKGMYLCKVATQDDITVIKLLIN